MPSVRRFAICLVGSPRSVVVGLLAMVLASVGMLLASVLPASTATAGVPFEVELTGEAEVTPLGVPNQGDLDGSGAAIVTINPGTGEVCWTVEVTGIEGIIVAHIHKASSTTNGPVVVPFVPDYSDGCSVVSRTLALDMVLNPTECYVNTHNAEFRLLWERCVDSSTALA